MIEKSLTVFEDYNIRRVYDDKEEKWYFSVVDIIQVLIQQSDYQTGRKYWNKLKTGESASKYYPKGHLFGLIKLNPQKPSPTLTRTAGASKPVHWKEKRFIGIYERAILQSFPCAFVWTGTWTDIYNRQGNSVPPLFMKAIAEHIKINVLQKLAA